ncbi:MAG: hypothetical protein ACT4P7_02935 [Gemmatimonadaceae bacterium]
MSDAFPDRQWRGRPAVPRFRFDERTAVQRQGAALLLPTAVASLLAYPVIEPMLVRIAGGVWGALIALVLVGVPLGATWTMADRGVPPGRAWKTGGLFAFASTALYAWIFSGAWV